MHILVGLFQGRQSMYTEISPLMRSALDATTRRLAGEFRVVFSDQTVARSVEDSFERVGDRPTAGPNLTPIFIERFAHQRVRAVAEAEGIVAKALPKVRGLADRRPRRAVTRDPAVDPV
jgi:hypothetical protein